MGGRRWSQRAEQGTRRLRLLHALGAQTARLARLRCRGIAFGVRSDRGYAAYSRPVPVCERYSRESSLRRPIGLARWAAHLRSKRMVTLWVVIPCEHLNAVRVCGMVTAYTHAGFSARATASSESMAPLLYAKVDE